MENSQKKPTFLFVPKQTIADIATRTRGEYRQKQQQQPQTDMEKEHRKFLQSESQKIVLDEDEYVAALEKIIERDFFPDLKNLRANSALLEAVDSGDTNRLRQLALEFLSHEQTDDDDDFKSGKSKGIRFSGVGRKNLDLSLDEFQLRYTSEDNASFSQIIARQNENRRKKYEMLHRDRLKELAGSSNKLLLTSGSSSSPNRPKLLTDGSTSSETSSSSIYANLKNALMHVPNGVGSVLLDSAHKGDEKGISYSSTRLPSVNLSTANTTSNPLKTLERLDPQGALRLSQLEPSYTPSASQLSSNTPLVNGFKMVPMTPTPAPDEGGNTPFLTWGFLESTPVLVDSNSSDVGPLEKYTEGPQFRMPEPPARDKLGKRLGDVATKEMRKRVAGDKKVSTSKPEESNDARIRMLSPAAQNLLKKTQRSPWIASPRTTSSISRKHTPAPLLVKTPRIHDEDND